MPTTDPRRAIEGLILPMAGHKGYAISFMVDVLAGVLTGSAFGTSVVGPYRPTGRSGVGHPADLRRHRGDGRSGRVRTAMETLSRRPSPPPPPPGTAEIFVPGEPEVRTAERLRSEGITFTDDTWGSLGRIAEATAVPLPNPTTPTPQPTAPRRCSA